MPSLVQSRMSQHSAPTQADLDFLNLLTAESTALTPLSPPRKHAHTPSHEQSGQHPPRKQLPRRENPMDALLLTAVLNGSGPVSRHHLGHGSRTLSIPPYITRLTEVIDRPGAYASCDESRPSSVTAPPTVKRQVVMRSEQAPRSERLRRERELADSQAAGQPGPSTLPSAIRTTSRGLRRSSESAGIVQTGSLASLSESGFKPKRRMSIDPAPVSQILQAASPSSSNFFTSRAPDSKPGASSSTDPAARNARSTPKLEVQCMVRTRIPTPHGEIFLHLYHNSQDSKEHMAIVYDPIQLHAEAGHKAPRGRKEIRSRTLDSKWREGETDTERIVRGAYIGRLEAGTDGHASVPMADLTNKGDVSDGMESIREEEDDPDILPLVRIHSECFTGETIGSMRCDCGEQLDEAMRLISLPQSLPSRDRKMSASLPTPGPSRSVSPSSTPSTFVPGRGVVIYLRQEGRGIGLLEKLRAYNLQDLGHDTVTANLMLGHGADERKYGVAAEILRDLGLADTSSNLGRGIRLLTNNPEKVEGLAKEGVSVKERVGMVPRDWKTRGHQGSPRRHLRELEDDEGLDDAAEREYGDWRNRRAGASLIGAGAASGPELEKYLRTKVERMGHRE